MKTPVLEALNEQIRKELLSAYTYWAMSAHFAAESFDGFAHWMKLQAEEELAHAVRIHAYVLSRGARSDLRSIEAPAADFGSPHSVFTAALDQERQVTESIHALYLLAQQHGDVATMRAMDWFVTEQVEEEENAQRAVDLLAKAGDSEAALLMLDREFAQRVPEPANEGDA